jgi:aminoglycoside phosphotransferase (APT) family kinase protein
VAQSTARRHARDLIPEAVLACVPGYETGGEDASALRLVGGTVNASYLVETKAGRFVVRMHEAGARSLGVDHQREAQLQLAAATAGVAPAVVHVDPQHRFLIMDHIPGPTWSRADFADAAKLRLLGTTLRTLHAVEPPIVADFDLRALMQAHRQRILAVAPAEAAPIDSMLRRADAALDAVRSSEREPALIHGDLHHSNLIGAERLWLLDWEYGAVTDPLYDLGCVLAYYPQAEPYAAALLEASGLHTRASLAMLRHAAWLYVLVSYLWHRVKRLGFPVRADELAIEQDLLQRLQ